MARSNPWRRGCERLPRKSWKARKGKWEDFREAAAQLIAEVMRHLQKEEINIVQRMECFLDGETDHRLAIQLVAERGHGNLAAAVAPSAPGRLTRQSPSGD